MGAILAIVQPQARFALTLLVAGGRDRLAVAVLPWTSTNRAIIPRMAACARPSARTTPIVAEGLAAEPDSRSQRRHIFAL